MSEGLQIGDTVHYIQPPATDINCYLFDPEVGCLAAIVTGVENAEYLCCTLLVLRRGGSPVSMPWVKYDESRKPGTWHYRHIG